MKPYYDHDGITIYHGDCREILPTLTAPVSLVLTDPPYGDAHDTDYTRFTGGRAPSRNHAAPVHGDDQPFDPAPFLSLADHVVLFGANRYSNHLPVGAWFIWDKRLPSGSKAVMSDAEVAWYSRNRGVYIFEHYWDGFNRKTERQETYHPTQKPVALMTWIIQQTKSTGLILDPFMGSGPVLLAAKLLSRPAIGIEIEERYCEIAAKRLAQSVIPGM